MNKFVYGSVLASLAGMFLLVATVTLSPTASQQLASLLGMSLTPVAPTEEFETVAGTISSSIETPIAFPTDANIINVKTDYGAVGDGVTDDTVAIQNALRENNKGSSSIDNFSPRTIYFPPGTYLISDTLVTEDPNTGEPRNAVRIVGAGTEYTTIKLQDNASGFESGEKFMIHMGNDGGLANTGYGNYIQHITIDAGSGNDGAVGVWYEVANSGAVEHVKIVSSDPNGNGNTGLYFPQSPVGSGYVKDLVVDGFDYGIHFRRLPASVNNIVFEDIHLKNQNVAGIWNEGKNIQILDLVSENNPIAILSEEINTGIVLVRGTLSGPGSGPAIDLRDGGFFYGRDVTASGFDNIITIGADDHFVGKTTMVEWSSHDYYKGLTQHTPTEDIASYISLNLPIKVSPEYHSNDFSTWANVTDFPGANDSERFQAAIDSGAETIYFPYGSYVIDEEVVVRGDVKKVDFMFSLIEGSGSVRVDNTSSTFVMLENVNAYIDFTHNSPDTVVIRNVGARPVTDITTGSGASGDLFVDNMGPQPRVNIGNGIHAWFRQLNRERRSFTNDGATVWNFGENNEFHDTGNPSNPAFGRFITKNGGTSEIIGGALDIRDIDIPSGNGAFIHSDNSTVSVVMVGMNIEGATINNVLKDFNSENDIQYLSDWLIDIPVTSRVDRIIIPLYVSPWHEGETPPEVDVTAPAQTTDVSANNITETEVVLEWTATGDDGTTGTATAYDIRYGTEAITDANFADATAVANPPTPSAAGAAESHTIDSLDPETTYYAALKTSDEVGNTSELSNVISFTTLTQTDTTPPSAVNDLSVTDTTETSLSVGWTATGDDGTTGTATAYDIRYGTEAITDANFANATAVANPPTPSAAGAAESLTLSSLTSDTTYYVALKVTDDEGNTSAISNITNGTTDEEQAPPPPPPQGEETVFEDSFEGGLAQWSQDSQNDWFHTSAAKITDSDAAGVNGRANDAELIATINLGGHTSATVSYSWFISGRLDNGEYLAFDVSTDGGNSWNEFSRLRGNQDQENTWITESHVFTDITELMIRFRGNMSFTLEDAYLDDVTVVAGTAGDSGGDDPDPVPPTSDTTPPSAVNDLSVTDTTETSLSVGWTATGDDGTTGTATAYDIRYGTEAITDANFANATAVANPPTPSAAGAAESLTLSSLTSDTTYYVALKVTDDEGNTSAISNITNGTTDEEQAPPPPPPQGEETVFEDSFEGGLAQWSQDSQNDWFHTSAAKITDSDAAGVNGRANDAELIATINLGGHTSATVSYSWFISGRLDNGEYLAFDVSTDGGNSWNEFSRLRGNQDQENTWITESHVFTDITELMIRFRGNMSFTLEDAYLDDVTVVAGTE